MGKRKSRTTLTDMETKRHKILVVEHNEKNADLISKALDKFGFECNPANDYQAVDVALSSSNSYDIILMDISGFDTEIWERCKKIHQLNIPLLIMSAKPSAALQQHGLRYGARGIIAKPVILNDFVKLIYSLINDDQEK
jgi:DNA-binding response OmpR family regulator